MRRTEQTITEAQDAVVHAQRVTTAAEAQVTAIRSLMAFVELACVRPARRVRITAVTPFTVV